MYLFTHIVKSWSQNSISGAYSDTELIETGYNQNFCLFICMIPFNTQDSGLFESIYRTPDAFYASHATHG